MQIADIPFGITDWTGVMAERKMGEAGWADWKVRQFGPIRVRLLEYSPGYKTDHWCVKGHIRFCVEGELVTELEDGRQFVLRPGMSYTNRESHLDCRAGACRRAAAADKR